MKSFVFALTLLISSLSFAQDSIKINAQTPKILTNLFYGKSLKFDAIEFTFVKVVTDSRCPKNVDCVWAGEITVLIDIYFKGEFSEQKVLNFSSKSQQNKELLNLFSSETLKITGFKVLPYPIYGKKINIEDYYIQLEVKS